MGAGISGADGEATQRRGPTTRPFAWLPLLPGQWARLPDSSLSRILLMVAQWAVGTRSFSHSLACVCISSVVVCRMHDPSVSLSCYLLSTHLM